MDVATHQAARARCMSVGQTSVDVSTFGGDLSAAVAARGPGKRYWLNSSAYAEAADVVLGAQTVLEGPGSGLCTLTLSSGARVVTDGFDGLTGTNPAVSPGVGQFALRHLTIEGGGGVRIYGYAYEVEDVTVRGTAAGGFYSEWTNADNPIPPDASMETRIRGLKTHHCGGTGFDFNGPHDSFLDTVHSYFNASGTGIRLGTKANGVHLDGGHAYGVDHTCAIEMLGAGQQVTSTQAEGANGPQVRILKAGSYFSGRVYSAQGNENVKGIVIGQAGDVGAGIRVDAIVENCWAGALDVTYDGGGSLYDLIVNAPSGKTVYVGTMPTNSQARINLLGGIALNGWAEPWIVGKQHYADDLNVRGRVVAVDGTFTVDGAGPGATVALASLAGSNPVDPTPGTWKLYLTTGTTGGTAKLVARGASGAVTTILDNIPT